MNTVINKENFWDEHAKHKGCAKSHAWSEMRYQYGAILAMTIIKRTIFAYIVAPAVILFTMFLLSAYTEGLSVLLNSMFVGNTELVTDADISTLLSAWHALAFVVFVVSWLFAPWRSPVEREVDYQMKIWWQKHGHIVSESGSE